MFLGLRASAPGGAADERGGTWTEEEQRARGATTRRTGSFKQADTQGR